ncbi:Hypothetical predicted protein [Prunus dulcis]|uniref:Uncharacterized protein n=1 Tax=Prunus dulcis TaxID=3755 RepID=A0A5E4GGJ5_PRUDU|nr:Hypothetical predicted protein [Prunus dulcis]
MLQDNGARLGGAERKVDAEGTRVLVDIWAFGMSLELGLPAFGMGWSLELGLQGFDKNLRGLIPQVSKFLVGGPRDLGFDKCIGFMLCGAGLQGGLGTFGRGWGLEASARVSWGALSLANGKGGLSSFCVLVASHVYLRQLGLLLRLAESSCFVGVGKAAESRITLS